MLVFRVQARGAEGLIAGLTRRGAQLAQNGAMGAPTGTRATATMASRKLKKGEYWIHKITNIFMVEPGMNVGESNCPFRWSVIWSRTKDGGAEDIYYKEDGVTPDVTHEPLESFKRTPLGQYKALFEFWKEREGVWDDVRHDGLLREKALKLACLQIFRGICRRCNEYHSHGNVEKFPYAKYGSSRRKLTVWCSRLQWDDLMAASPPEKFHGVKKTITEWHFECGSDFHGWLDRCAPPPTLHCVVELHWQDVLL